MRPPPPSVTVRGVESTGQLDTPAHTSRPGVVTAVVCLALAAVTAAMASLNVALPDIARDTHATQTELVWVIDAYSLAFAALLLPGGAIGDRFGRRFALVAGLLLFGGGSAAATCFAPARSTKRSVSAPGPHPTSTTAIPESTPANSMNRGASSRE